MQKLDPDGLKAALAHVFWLGGPSDAGKSTVARLVAEQLRWQMYPCDFHEHNHFIARADPAQHPAMFAEMAKSVEARWITPTPEELFAGILTTNDERFPMILSDLRVMPAHPPILVEGPRLFPHLVAPLLTRPQQAIWLLPTDDFVWASQARRDKPPMRHGTSDPERFRTNFLRRDALLAAYIRHEVAAHGLPSLAIDGSLPPAAIVGQVAAHYAATGNEQ